MENTGKLTIREYCTHVSRSADGTNKNLTDWTTILLNGGYYRVIFTRINEWTEMHEWTRSNIGEQHYAWNGNNFWFENEKDAVLFTLRWS